MLVHSLLKTSRKLCYSLGTEVRSVGCIYASYPQYKSNIFQHFSNSFRILSKHQKLLKNIFLNFSVFLLTFVRVSFHLSVLCIVRRFVFCFRLEV